MLSVILGAAVIFWALNSWGVPPERVAWAFQWLTWGPTLGPVKLTTLNVGAAILALYLGFWLSRLIRSLMRFRIFPRTGLDPGVQYTISTTVHYVVLILAGLVALNILGFPLTNLALVAGALGVGIGFGLQNIVNNFISGLILLFERPIKVGDLLVIDGQWGTVKRDPGAQHHLRDLRPLGAHHPQLASWSPARSSTGPTTAGASTASP